MVLRKLKKCLTSPSQLTRLVIFIACLLFAIYQVANCVIKLLTPPISTYYGFHLNESMSYPSVTICRKSPFKIEYFANYGLEKRTPNLMTVDLFRHFNFDKYTIEDFLNETTWQFEEVFGPYSYNGMGNEMADAEWTEFQSINYGRCFVWTARSTSNTFSMSGGWWFYLKHNQKIRVVDDFGVSMNGFEIFIHQPSEIMTSENTRENNFIEYLYLEAAEDLRISLKYQAFKRVRTTEYPCEEDLSYSQSKCLEQCFHEVIANRTNCTLPWLWLLPNPSSYPQCSNFSQVNALISNFSPHNRKQLIENCTCPSPCRVIIYTPSIISRKEVTQEWLFPDSFIAMYYTNNIVTVMCEMVGYHFSSFVSDIGGSLGFLLGLSVIGTVAVMEKILCSLIKSYYKAKKTDNERTEDVPESQTVDSSEHGRPEAGKKIKQSLEHRQIESEGNASFFENLRDFNSVDFRCYERTLIGEANRF